MTPNRHIQSWILDIRDNPLEWGGADAFLLALRMSMEKYPNEMIWAYVYALQAFKDRGIV